MLRLLSIILPVGCLGCSEPRLLVESPKPAAPPAALGTQFHADDCGSIRGRVVWSGALPTPTPDFAVVLFTPQIGFVNTTRPNPHAPQIDPQTRGLKNAVVFLENVDPQRAAPWPHPPVRVVVRDQNILIEQGAQYSSIGFVRRGSAIELVNSEPGYFQIRARGAAFFTLAFAQPNQPLRRTLHENGFVELLSGSGQYWARAWLWVGDHGLITRTNERGDFELTDVPAGTYRIVARHPNPQKARHERDPETGLIVRWYFRESWEVARSITVAPRMAASIDLPIQADR